MMNEVIDRVRVPGQKINTWGSSTGKNEANSSPEISRIKVLLFQLISNDTFKGSQIK